MFFDSVRIDSDFGDFYLYEWSKLPPYLFVEQSLFADNIIQGCLGDYISMMNLRSFLSHTSDIQFNFSQMNDHQVLDAIIHLVKNGKAFLVKKRTFLVKQSLQFDGKRLRWIDCVGSNKACWPAVSGRPDYQGKKCQQLHDYGPLPEGNWLVKQMEYQKIALKDAVVGMTGVLGIKRGGWPGGVMAWGAHRVWLHPKEGTNTFGRKGFSIHGGWQAGSAGCIDMTSCIGEFISMFLEYGKDMELYVEYQ